MKRIIASLLITAGIAACAPSDGPKTARVTSSARSSDIPILSLTETAVAVLGAPKSGNGLSRFAGKPYVPGIIKPGDTVSVSVFDTGEAGLFSASDSSSIGLGEYTVSPSGTISLPFVGTLNVAGRSTDAAQSLVTRKLRETAVNPYASVNIVRKDTDSFAVQGAVEAGGRFILTAQSERVLDAIAAAGGPTRPAEATIVKLIRGGATGQQILSKIIESPQENVRMQPGDVLMVGGGDASFMADGAFTRPGEFKFVEGDLSLGQAVAKAGGLSDARANPRGVFIFRRLAPGESLILRYKNGRERQVTGDVIFRANFKDVAERSRANRFQIRNGDTLYVGNAPLANFSKYFQIFNTPPEMPAPPEQ